MESSEKNICQSCGLQLIAPGIQGGNTDESENPDYCRFCFRHGKFLDPDMTKEQMLQKTAEQIAAKTKISVEQGKNMARQFIPKLKRWREEPLF